MRKGYWVVRTYKAGGVVEKIKFFVEGERPSRSTRRHTTELKKQEWNEQNAVRRVARLIHLNFRRGEDFLLGLDYDDAHLPADRAGAQHRLRCYLERVRRACKRAGIALRYICVSSDRDGRTGERVRLHHHVVINAEAVEIALQKWNEGSTYRSKLRRSRDMTQLAVYLLEQVQREEEGEKSYIPSRTLRQSEPQDRICAGTAELQVPRGCVLCERAAFVIGRPQYIRYLTRELMEEYPESDSADTAEGYFARE